MEDRGVVIIVLTILQRCGFMLIHSGLVPTTNINSVYLSYLFNFGLTSLIFIPTGSVLAMGTDWNGIIGTELTPQQLNESTVLWSFSVQCTSVIQLVTAGRIHILSEIVVTYIFTCFLLPLVIHGAWSDHGWMRNLNLCSKFSYVDISGGSIVHLFSGSFALGALLVFTPKFININRLDPTSLINSKLISFLGYMVVIFTTMGLMLSSPFINPSKEIISQMNVITAVSTGLIIATLIYYPVKKENHRKLVWILQSALSAQILISSGLVFYSVLIVFLFSSLSVLVCYLTTKLRERLNLQDYCNVLAVHVVNGFLGSTLVPFAEEILANNKDEVFRIFITQSVCCTLICLFGFITSFTVFSCLKLINILMNSDERALQDANATDDSLKESLLNRENVWTPGFEAIEYYLKLKNMDENFTDNEESFQHVTLIPV